MWWPLLKRFWPAIAGLAVLLGAYAWHVSAVREARQEAYLQAKAEYATELDHERSRWQEINRETNDAKDRRIAELQKRATRVIRRDPPIRMCEPAREVRVPASPDSGSAGGSVLPPGRDLQPELVQYGRDCEALRQELMTVKEKLERLH